LLLSKHAPAICVAIHYQPRRDAIATRRDAKRLTCAPELMDTAQKKTLIRMRLTE